MIRKEYVEMENATQGDTEGMAPLSNTIWEVDIKNDRPNENVDELLIYLDGEPYDTYTTTIPSGQYITYYLTVSRYAYHTLETCAWDEDVLDYTCTYTREYISGWKYNMVSIQDDNGIQGTKRIHMLFATPTDWPFGGYDGDDLETWYNQALARMDDLALMYSSFSYNAFTYELMGVYPAASNKRNWIELQNYDSTQAGDKTKHADVIKEAIGLVDTTWDFHHADEVVVVVPTQGKASTGWYDVEKRTDDAVSPGYKLKGGVFLKTTHTSYNNRFILPHEFGHVLCLGHTDAINKYKKANDWYSLMGANKAHMIAYQKWALGWVTLNVRSSWNGYLTALVDLEHGGSIYAWPIAQNHYYIIEYRRYQLPYEGLKSEDHDIVVIWETLDSFEVQFVDYTQNQDYYDIPLIGDMVKVRKEWIDSAYGTWYGSNGFVCYISWTEGQRPYIYYTTL